MPQLDNLIAYLEQLTKMPDKQQAGTAATNEDYNKDYTALLLNCYVKKEKINEIKNYIQQATQDEGNNNPGQPPKRIFDVTTAIDVCREHKATRDQAITLASQQKQY